MENLTRMMRKAMKLCLLAVMFPVSANASPNFSQIDAIIEDVKARADMPSGTAVIVIKGDRVIHEGYFGKADIEAGTAVDKNTVFYIASTTKAFLALAVLLAEERGEISRNTTLQELFPDLAFQNVDADTVTVKHLMAHTSGIKSESLTWAASYTGLHDAISRRQMIAASDINQDAPLGDFEYSNIGYNILAVWFDEHYRKDWRDTMDL